jgi:Family of unknown function (DUF6252)
MKNSFLFFALCVLVFVSCKKEKADIITPNTPATVPTKEAPIQGFQASISKAGAARRGWVSAPSSAVTDSATPGVDYYAISGAINPNELTLFSFGRFDDDTTSVTGRITLFLTSVSNTGTYLVGGSSTSNAQITLVDGAAVETYATDRADNQGSVYVSEYDTLHHVLSGVFTFKAIAGSGIISIDSGSFYHIPFR